MLIKLRIKELLAIKERRENRKLPIRVIAEETGLARNTVMGYINNTVTRLDLPILQIWRDYLGVHTSDLFVDEPEVDEETTQTDWMTSSA